MLITWRSKLGTRNILCVLPLYRNCHNVFRISSVELKHVRRQILTNKRKEKGKLKPAKRRCKYSCNNRHHLMSSIVNHKSLRSFQILQISIKSFVLIASSFSLDYAYKFVPIFKIDTSKKSLTLHSHMTRNIADPAVHTHSTTGEYKKAEIQYGISNARKE